MASTTSNGYSFSTTGSGRVIIKGPGIQSSGIDLGYADSLSPESFTSAASSPNVDEAAKQALENFANNPSSISTIKTDLTPAETPPAPAAPTPEAPTPAAQDKAPATAPTTGDDAAPPSTAPAAPGEQPTKVSTPPDASQASTIGASQKENKPGTQANDTKMGTSDELPGRRVYNPLSTLSSYTYNITLYMVNPDALNLFVLSGGKIAGQLNTTNGGYKNGFYVVAQSGGINNQSEARALTYSGIPGDKGGGFDYYIDDLRFETLTPAKDSSSTPTNSINFKFKIVEPMGFNFITDLTNAARKVMGDSVLTKDSKTEKLPYQQHYMLSIKFYGYDVNGNLVTSKNFADSDGASASQNAFSQNASTDNNAIFERFYPINLTNITYTIDGRAITYQCDAVGTPLQTAFGEKRGIVTKPTELFATTVEEALTGVLNSDNGAPFWEDSAAQGQSATNGREQTDQDPRKGNKQSGNASGNKVRKLNSATGLLQVLNEDLLNQELQGHREKAPKMYVQFDPKDPSIRKAAIVNKDRQSAAGSGAAKSSGSNAQASKNAEKSNTSGSRITIAAGTPIVQAIDDIISQSSFIDNALNVVNNTNPEVQPQNTTPSQTLKWYTINPVVKITGDDNKTNDWVYDICYQIQSYDIPYVRTNYKGATQKYYGPHKRYEYWFTGKNTEVLKYTQEFNALYYTVSTTAVGTDNSTETNGSGATVPSASQGGSDSRVNGPKTNRAGLINQNVKAALYSTADQAKAQITIIGDPDYLFQTVLGSPSLDKAYSKRYGPGFTINPNGGQVFIEIQFNNAQDYGDNGIVNISDKVQFYPKTILSDRGIKGLVYQVIQVNSSFSGGKFQQVLELLLVDERLLLSEAEKKEQAEREKAEASKQRTNDTSKDSKKNVPGKKADTKPAPKNTGGNVLPPLDKSGRRTAATDPRVIQNKSGQPVADDDAQTVSNSIGAP